MSVIIRLQNLPWSANAGDIRSFFKGLGIPDGGVHIVGGENGDAFIAFSTDEDARQAMALTGGRLKETQVSLLLSSRAEMQKVIETARQQTMSFMAFSNDTTQQTSMAETKVAQFPPAPVPQPQPPIITSNTLSGILAQQMFQQHQIQFMSNQNISAMMNPTGAPKSIPTDPNALNQLKQAGNSVGAVNSPRGERRSTRSRSKSRERRSRRSRSRDRGSRRRRSRSSERRSDRRRRDRSRERSNERNRGGNNRGDRSRSSYDRDHSSSEPSKRTQATVQKANNAPNDLNVAKPVVNPWENQMIAPQAMNFQNPPPQTAMKTFPLPMGNMPMMNPMVPLPIGQPPVGQQTMGQAQMNNAPIGQAQMNNAPIGQVQMNNAPIGQFPFGSPPPIIPPQMTIGAGMTNTNVRTMPDQFQTAPFNSAPPKINPTSESTTIRMQNLDLSLHYSLIRKFFAGLHIPSDGIKILNNEFGKRRGEAVVRFACPFFAQQALQKNGFVYNGLPMKIFMISEEDYCKEVDSYRPSRHTINNKEEDLYLGINNDSNTNNINNTGNRFQPQKDESLDLDAVYNRTDQFGRRMRSEEELSKNACDSQTISTHIIDDDDDVVLVSDTGLLESSGCTTLLIEDLPSFTSEQDIKNMFSDFTLLQIVLVPEPRNVHAFVKFLNKDDAAVALKVKYNHRIGHKQVNVSECTDQAYEQAKAEYMTHEPMSITQMPQFNNPLANLDGPTYGNANNEGSGQNSFGNTFRNKMFQPNTDTSSKSFTNNQFNDMLSSNAVQKPFNSTMPVIQPNSDDQSQSMVSNMNNSDPRRRKQMEHQQQQQPNFQEKNKFSASHQQPNNQSGFGPPQQHQMGFRGPQPHPNQQQFQDFGVNRNTFNGPPLNQFGGPPPTVIPNHTVNTNAPNFGGSMGNNFTQHSNNDACNQNQFQPNLRPQPINQQMFDSCFLHVSNLEFRITEQEIRDWFAEISVYPKAVFQLRNNRGLTNGQIVCQFNTTEDAARGQMKNRMKMRSRMAYVRLMPPKNAAEALATIDVLLSPEELSGDSNTNQTTQPRLGNNGNDGFNRNVGPNNGNDFENRVNNLVPLADQKEEISKPKSNPNNPFLRKPQLDPENEINDVTQNEEDQNDDDGNDKDYNVGQDENNDEQEANEDEQPQENDIEPTFGDFGCDQNYMNNQPNHMMYMNRNRNNPNFNRGRGGRGGNNYNHNMMNRSQNNNMGPPHPPQRNINGCIVALGNVPFQANAIDIMRFFNGFQLCADDIIRRYLDDGSPTGDARVCFASPMDAMAAIDQCRNGRLMNRVIQMMLLN